MIVVLHDWGSLLGFDWMRQHPDRVQGIAYMEAILQPMTWADFPYVDGPLLARCFAVF